MSGLKIDGMNAIKAALQELPIKLEKKVIRAGLREGAKVVLNAARAEAPELSGVLRKNIKIRGGVKSKKGTIGISVGVGAKDFKGQSFYAGFVLYGHHVGSRKLGDKRKFVPANNFLQRAYENSKELAATTTIEAWKELVEGVLGTK